ncbi:MAG: glycosyltransferase family 4 protein [Candidatus Omnitrophica bacterium]|nr:glycosyltransferase family 4 protein [Candidatus Omnitrophota bacterium]MDD5552850.1 glycosyltransferase family 4 protein [Candidatus Omnitrophota bacterium]
MRAVKVLYISYDSALEPIPQSQVIPYLKELSGDGYIFHWLSFDKPRLLRSGRQKEIMRDDLAKNNIIWHSLNYYRKPYLLAKAFNIVCGVFAAAFYTVKEDIAIIHCRSEVASVIGYIVSRFFRKKMLYDRRGFMAEDYVEGGMWKGRSSFLYKAMISIDNKLLASSDRVVVLTQKMKDWLVENRPSLNLRDKTRIIPCCVDISRFKRAEGKEAKSRLGLEGKFVFVYSGSLGTWYLLSEMIDFFSCAGKIIPNAHFLILTMSDHGIARKAISRKGLSAGDFTIKTADFSEVPQFLRSADCAICFIKPVVSKYASSPTKLAEFLASGLPVVINKGIGDSDRMLDAEKAGLVIKEFTDEEYRSCAEQLTRLFKENGVLRERCVGAARKYFSLSDGIDKYRRIYLELSK